MTNLYRGNTIGCLILQPLIWVGKLTINLKPGNYILTAYNPVTSEQKGFNVKVLPNS